MIALLDKKQDCCGCTACKTICPKQAITMQPDEEGFLYPQIHQELCAECGLCKKVCAFQNGYDTVCNLELPEVYAVKHKSDDVRYVSSSGGMFTVLSDEILFNGGVVYGVDFDENMVACHQRAESKTQRNKFRGSKYVQSDVRQAFKDVNVDLKTGKQVLFTGTPCQVAGLKEYLIQIGTDINNLLLCDNVCHGTPSPLIFSDYLRFCETKREKKIVNYFCRSKINGWHSHTEKTVYANGQEDYKSILSQLYKEIFHSHIALRPSCHNCKYTNLKRPSDITIADFWGIEKTMPEFDDNKGISLVLLNTAKGQEIFEKVKDGIVFTQSNMADCLQPNLKEPTKPSSKREMFWLDYQENGFEYVVKKYGGYGAKGSIKRVIIKLLRKSGLVPIAKRIIGR